MCIERYILVICVFLLLTGCVADKSRNTMSQNDQSPSVEPIRPIETEDIIDYSQYIGKTWVEKNGTANVISFSIEDIIDGQLSGDFSAYITATPCYSDIKDLTGTVNKDTAQCQFSDSSDNEGTIEMLFRENNEIEATITFTKKSQYVEPRDGTFLFRPFNLADLKCYDILEEHTINVNLNSWGDVRFVPIKLTGGTREPSIASYLADNNGNILYRFLPDIPRGIDLKDVTCVDVNEDKFKDFIIIEEAEDYKGDMLQFAMIYLQREDGKLINDRELDNEINESGYNQDLDTVIKFLQERSSVVSSFIHP